MVTDRYTFNLDQDGIYHLFFDDNDPIYHVCKHDLSAMILNDILILVNNAYIRGVRDCAAEMTVKAIRDM